MPRFILFFFLLPLIFLTGCSLSPMKVTPMSTYIFSHSSQSIAATPDSHSSKTLLITTPIASPGYDSSRMIYVTIPFQLRSFSNHRWAATPAQLLLPLMADAIRATHRFHAVVTTPFSGAAYYELNTQLLVLQQEFLQPISQVRLVVEVTLQDVTTGRVIANHVFQVLVPASENTPYGGVLATNQAVHQMLRKMVRYVNSSTKLT